MIEKVTCERCVSRETGDDGHFRVNKSVLVSILSLFFFVAVAAGGWVYSYASQAKDVADLVARTTTLELRQHQADVASADIANRLSRMEPMLELLVHHMDEKRP